MRPQFAFPSFPRAPRALVKTDQNNPLQEQPDAEQTGAFVMLREVGGPDRGVAIGCWLWASAAPLGLLAVLSWAVVGPTHAQTAAPAEKKAEQLEQIDVTAPRRKPPARRAAPGTQPAPVPAPAPALTAAEQRGANSTPLNTNVIAESGSRL